MSTTGNTTSGNVINGQPTGQDWQQLVPSDWVYSSNSLGNICNDRSLFGSLCFPFETRVTVLPSGEQVPVAAIGSATIKMRREPGCQTDDDDDDYETIILRRAMYTPTSPFNIFGGGALFQNNLRADFPSDDPETGGRILDVDGDAVGYFQPGRELHILQVRHADRGRSRQEGSSGSSSSRGSGRGSMLPLEAFFGPEGEPPRISWSRAEHARWMAHVHWLDSPMTPEPERLLRRLLRHRRHSLRVADRQRQEAEQRAYEAERQWLSEQGAISSEAWSI